MYINYSFFLHL